MRALLSPPPLRGRVRVGGSVAPSGRVECRPGVSVTPRPNPPPQGGRGQNLRIGWLVVLGWALTGTPLFAQTVTARAEVDRDKIRLSDTVLVTLTVEGLAPLRVELPEPLLAKEAAAAWYVRPRPEPAVVAPLPGGRERWSRAFRLDPLPGGPPVAFAPLKVTAGTATQPEEVPVNAVEVTVQTALATAKPEDARPVTGIETLPPPPTDHAGPGVWLVAVPAGLVVVGLLVGLRRWRVRNRPLPPAGWAATEFDRLEGEAGVALADRLAAVLRGYVERRYGVPAPRLTTAELAVEAGRAGWPADGLREVLERCDRAKFAGEAPDAAEARELLTRAREWVATQSPPVATGGL
jgi:hypothetical protein